MDTGSCLQQLLAFHYPWYQQSWTITNHTIQWAIGYIMTKYVLDISNKIHRVRKILRAVLSCNIWLIGCFIIIIPTHWEIGKYRKLHRLYNKVDNLGNSQLSRHEKLNEAQTFVASNSSFGWFLITICWYWHPQQLRWLRASCISLHFDGPWHRKRWKLEVLVSLSDCHMAKTY